MINPTAGWIKSGSGKGYGRYTFSLSDLSTSSQQTKQDSKETANHKAGTMFLSNGIKKPLKSVVSRLVKLLSSYNRDVELNDVDIKYEDKSPSGFITIFKTESEKSKK
jgi:hypothetical protein